MIVGRDWNNKHSMSSRAKNRFLYGRGSVRAGVSSRRSLRRHNQSDNPSEPKTRVVIFGGGDEFVAPRCSAVGCHAHARVGVSAKTGMPRGHESADNPSLRKNMATPRPTQDIDSILRVAMPPDTLPQRMATPRFGFHTTS